MYFVIYDDPESNNQIAEEYVHLDSVVNRINELGSIHFKVIEGKGMSNEFEYVKPTQGYYKLKESTK